MEIDVQNRTTQDHQGNFADLWNEELLPRFDITDWILEFNAVEERDELRTAQTMHTKVASALTALRCGLNVDINELGKLKIWGKGELVEGGPGTRSGEPPRDMAGKPREWEEGEASRTSGERFELAKEVARIPISWESLTQTRIGPAVFMIEQDQNEVFVSWNSTEISGTRTASINVSKVVSSLLENVMVYIKGRLIGRGVKIDENEWNQMLDMTVQSVRRDYKIAGSYLIQLANYLENLELYWVAEKVDNLRSRIMSLELGTPIQPPQEEESQ